MLEYAGARDGLVAALPAIREHLSELPSFIWDVPHQDRQLKIRLEELGLSSKPVNVPHHTIRIIDYPTLMCSLQGFFTERLRGTFEFGNVEDGYSIRHNYSGEVQECRIKRP